MSLGIAKIFDGKIYVHADSVITGEGIPRHDPAEHTVLKAVLLSGQFCLLYAGELPAVGELLEYVYKVNNFSPQQLVNVILKVHIHYQQKTDFVLALYVENKPYLFEFKQGKKIRCESTAWVGFQRGFNFFQSKYLSNSNEKHTPEKFRNAFDAVINEGAFDVIGNFRVSVIPATLKDSDLKFMDYEQSIEMAVSMGATEVVSFKTNGFDSRGGTASNGAFAISRLSTQNRLRTGYGFYFGHGKFGYVFSPYLFGIWPKVISNCDAKKFVEESKKIGVHLRGLTFEGTDNIMLKHD